MYSTAVFCVCVYVCVRSSVYVIYDQLRRKIIIEDSVEHKRKEVIKKEKRHTAVEIALPRTRKERERAEEC